LKIEGFYFVELQASKQSISMSGHQLMAEIIKGPLQRENLPKDK
jgi:hypothetical protein